VSFQHIRGHEKILSILARIIKTRRVSHAYLFSGLEGIGKRLAAIAFSKTLLCSSGGLESCGSCSACVQVDQGNHPDFFLVEPEKGTITIDAIRNIKRGLSRTSFAGGYKFCVIDSAEKMNANAQNGLLKTLEEPTPDTVIFLITGNPYLLLPTILSRCQHLRFQALAPETAAALVMEKEAVDALTASLMVELTGGSPGKALELESDSFKELAESWVDCLSSASSQGQDPDLFSLGETFSRDKDSLHLRLNFLRLWFRDMILYKIYGDPGRLLNRDKADVIARYGHHWSLEKLVKALFWIEDHHQAIDRNVNPQLSLEALFMKLHSKREGSLQERAH
jgi:DNA polymerase-3 subunit delta'